MRTLPPAKERSSTQHSASHCTAGAYLGSGLLKLDLKYVDQQLEVSDFLLVWQVQAMSCSALGLQPGLPLWG